MVHDTHTRRRSYCWTLTGNPTQGIQPLRVTPNLGSGPHFGIMAHLSYYYGLLFDFRQFHVAPQMLSTQCNCHNLLITLIAGLCLQHLTAVHEVRCHIAMACCKTRSTFAKVVVKIHVTHFLVHTVDNYAVDNIIIHSNNGDKTTSGLSAVSFMVCCSARSAT